MADKSKITIPAKPQYAKLATSLEQATRHKLGPAIALFDLLILRPNPPQNQKLLLAISKQYGTDEPLLLINWTDGSEEAILVSGSFMTESN